MLARKSDDISFFYSRRSANIFTDRIANRTFLLELLKVMIKKNSLPPCLKKNKKKKVNIRASESEILESTDMITTKEDRQIVQYSEDKECMNTCKYEMVSTDAISSFK